MGVVLFYEDQEYLFDFCRYFSNSGCALLGPGDVSSKCRASALTSADTPSPPPTLSCSTILLPPPAGSLFHPHFIQCSSNFRPLFIHFLYTFIHFSSTFGTLLADTPPPSHPELLYYPPPAPVGRFFIQSGQFLFLAFVHFFDIDNPPTQVSTLCHILGQLLITTCCQQ